jgi:peptidoglycan/xylan/chitin deacetylase (PgdA/CDA1 family)
LDDRKDPAGGITPLSPSTGSGLSLGERIGMGALAGAALLALFDPRLSIIILAGFILLCGIASFFPRFGFFLPIISRGTPAKKAVALTFDDGPDPLSTPPLLRLLAARGVKATFFVIGKHAAAHPELIKAILRQGHAIANHSYTHDNLVMFRSAKSIAAEIASTQQVLQNLGIRPLAFRPPVGITGPRLQPALSKTGLYIVNFSCRAIDGGNRWIKNLSKKILKRIRPGDIVALHDANPPNPSLLPAWLNEIELLLDGIQTRGLTVLPLAELIDRPVMLAASGNRFRGHTNSRINSGIGPEIGPGPG